LPSVRAGLKMQIEYVLQAEEESGGNAEVYDRIMDCTDTSLVIEVESSPRWRKVRPQIWQACCDVTWKCCAVTET
jgi:hypothetical protein